MIQSLLITIYHAFVLHYITFVPQKFTQYWPDFIISQLALFKRLKLQPLLLTSCWFYRKVIQIQTIAN